MKRLALKFFEAAAEIIFRLRPAICLVLLAPCWCAAGSRNITVTVRVVDDDPPAAVADLAAVPNAGEGMADLSWTAPDEDSPSPSGLPAGGYQVRYATFSVDSAGSTATWWNAALDIPVAPAPGSPGTPEALVVSGFIPGVTAYFAIKSADAFGNLSGIDTKAATPGQQAYALTIDVAPATPRNFAAAAGNAQVSLSWTGLTALERTSDFDYYRLVRSTDGVNFVPVATTTAVSYLDTGLANGTEYTYHLTAVDMGPPGPALESSTATAIAMPKASIMPPAVVAGLSGALSADGQYFTLNWSSVTTNLDGTPITDLAFYRVYKFAGLSASTMAVFEVSQASFTDTVGGQNFYYKIRAVDADSNESPDSNFTNSAAAPVIAVLCDDGETSMTVPAGLGDELHQENNSTGSDLVIVPVRLAAEETGAVLRSYRFEVRRAEDDQPVDSFVFSKPLVNVTFGFAAGGGVQTLGRDGRSVYARASADRTLGIYWDNGARFMNLGGHIDFVERTVSVLVSSLGRYQLRLAGVQAGLLADGSPYPRTITPNADGINDRVFFFFGATSASKEGKVYDLKGAFVGDMRPGPAPDSSLVWDGKDGGGNTVSAGIYLYKVSLGGESVTGTVVVAR